MNSSHRFGHDMSPGLTQSRSSTHFVSFLASSLPKLRELVEAAKTMEIASEALIKQGQTLIDGQTLQEAIDAVHSRFPSPTP